MSRVAKKPVALPKGVELKVDHSTLSIKGPKGTLSMDVHPQIGIEQTEEGVQIKVNSGDRKLVAMAGTTRALLANMVTGVSEGFERKLEVGQLVLEDGERPAPASLFGNLPRET